jgi:hypothetical protein
MSTHLTIGNISGRLFLNLLPILSWIIHKYFIRFSLGGTLRIWIGQQVLNAYEVFIIIQVNTLFTTCTIPNRSCLIVIAGRHPSSSLRILKQIVPVRQLLTFAFVSEINMCLMDRHLDGTEEGQICI